MTTQNPHTLMKVHPTEHLADVWLDWVQRHYTVTRIELTQVSGGWQATAHLDPVEHH